LLDCVINTHEDGIIQEVNPAVARVLGYWVAELIDRCTSMPAPEPVRGALDDYIALHARTRQAIFRRRPRSEWLA
jgi:PAS domain S-box-containing protein